MYRPTVPEVLIDGLDVVEERPASEEQDEEAAGDDEGVVDVVH